MDIVYIVGSDPHHAYTELRYSIRSMQKHLADMGRLFIVGEDPGFLKDFYHIPYPDSARHNNNLNIYNKILAACQCPDVGDEFMSCSDDHFLLADFMAETFPNFYYSDLSVVAQNVADKSYKTALENTYNALESRKLTTIHFNVHSPFRYKKSLFLSLMPTYDWTVNKGYVSKSLYANSLHLQGELLEDLKIHTPKTATAIRRRLKGARVFSTNEHSMNDPMKAFLQELFPVPSLWE